MLGVRKPLSVMLIAGLLVLATAACTRNSHNPAESTTSTYGWSVNSGSVTGYAVVRNALVYNESISWQPPNEALAAFLRAYEHTTPEAQPEMLTDPPPLTVVLQLTSGDQLRLFFSFPDKPDIVQLAFFPSEPQTAKLYGQCLGAPGLRKAAEALAPH